MITAKQIAEFLNDELKTTEVEDSSNNGLQVENTGEITKIGFAVDACMETFEKAVAAGCQMLIVHHGMIWEGIKYIKRNTYNRIKYLIKNNLAIYASHLPLDMHNEYGNNIKLALLLNLQNLQAFGYLNGKAISFIGDTNATLETIKDILQKEGMKVTVFANGPKQIKRMALLSGQGKAEVYQAVSAGADTYITGELAYSYHHVSKENKINIVCGGHYATEKYGVKALMPLLKEKFNVEVEFIDVPVPM